MLPAAQTAERSPSATSAPAPSRWTRIIPVALIMYTIAFIDRTNISLALPRIRHDLHLDPQQAGTVAGIFFWGYLALQIPGGHLAKHWSPKKFISVLLVAWSLAAIGCGLARTYHELLLLRLLLGVAESGVFPATLILLSHWFSRAERARANAMWLLCLPTAVIFSSPFSGWMLDHWGWRAMLIAEGALPLFWLAIWIAFIQDHPAQARWLPPAERDSLVATLRAESSDLEPSENVSYLRALMRPQVFVLAAIYFCFVSGQMGLLFWLPSATETFKKLSSLRSGIFFTFPFFVGAVALLISVNVVNTYQPFWKNQGYVLEMAEYLRDHQFAGRIGGWNSGIPGYFTDGRIINLDGLVNDQIYPYALKGEVVEYIDSAKIKYIVDFPPFIANQCNWKILGYDGESLDARLTPVHRALSKDPGDPWREFTLFEVQDRSSERRANPTLTSEPCGRPG